MRSQKYFVAFGLIYTATALLLAGCGSAANTANANNQPQIVDVTTTQAVVMPIPTYFEATGNLASDASVDVAPAVGGKINR